MMSPLAGSVADPAALVVLNVAVPAVALSAVKMILETVSSGEIMQKSKSKSAQGGNVRLYVPVEVRVVEILG
jgi:hypothetical protein